MMQKLVKTQKSTNNPMSSFGLINENMEVSQIHLAALKIIFFSSIIAIYGVWGCMIGLIYETYLLQIIKELISACETLSSTPNNTNDRDFLLLEVI